MKQKEMDRLLRAVVRSEAKHRGWKSVGGFAYWINGPLFFQVVHLATAKPGFYYASLRVKWLSLDRILWRVLGMPTNDRAPFSVHANGAFALSGREVGAYAARDLEWLPGVLERQVASTAEQAAVRASEVVPQASSLSAYVEFIALRNQAFMKANPNAAANVWAETLLAAMEAGDFTTAARIAKERIAAADSGGFISSGRTFYERALQLCNGDA